MEGVWLIGVAPPRNSPTRGLYDKACDVGDGETRPVAGGFPSGIKERHCAAIGNRNPLAHRENAPPDIRGINMELDYASERPIERTGNSICRFDIDGADHRLRGSWRAERN
jgi:hypothetical protein